MLKGSLSQNDMGKYLKYPVPKKGYRVSEGKQEHIQIKDAGYLVYLPSYHKEGDPLERVHEGKT